MKKNKPEEINPAPTKTVDYTIDNNNFANPERGFYWPLSPPITDSTQDFAGVTSKKCTLAYSYVRLDNYLPNPIDDSPIANSLFQDLADGLARARDVGVKVILRFVYNEDSSGNDTTLNRMIKHIEQIQSNGILVNNADVIAVVQAGFIGAWGEWHSSSNMHHESDLSRREILTAILKAIPADRMTQIRTPMHKRVVFSSDDPISETDGFSGTNAARTGHHNDCFLVNASCNGTYFPPEVLPELRTYVASETRFTPMGGETCCDPPIPCPSPFASCVPAISEMRRMHYSFLNLDWHQTVIQSWRDKGCFQEIERSFGYRLVLLQSQLPPQAKPGGVFDLIIHLQNVGFASMYNPRDALLVLNGPGGKFEAIITNTDPRRWFAGERTVISGRVTLPSGLGEGDYTLDLFLPDKYQRPEMKRPEYAVRFANLDTWDKVKGSNRLGTINISNAGPGDSVDGQLFGIGAE